MIRRLASIRPSRLFVICDGPREGVPGEYQATADVRRLFERLPWSCEVRLNFSERNLGCRHRVVTGLNWVFEQVDRAVILEDDCIPSDTFFPFCSQLLERYADDLRVGSICGMTHDDQALQAPESYRFSRYCFVWGWATWRRAWKLYDESMTSLSDGTMDPLLREILPSLWARLYWKMLFLRCANGKLNTWDYQWALTCWRQGLMHAVPCVSLVENIGIGPGSTHTRKSTLDVNNILALRFPLLHPHAVESDRLRDDAVERRVFSKGPINRMKWIIRRFFL